MGNSTKKPSVFNGESSVKSLFVLVSLIEKEMKRAEV